jgi:hypothetical protein
MSSLSLPEEFQSELLVKLCAMLELESVVIKGSIVISASNVGGLSELIGGEEICEEEPAELQAAAVGTEHILVVEKVSTEEDQEALEVDDLRVLSGLH